MFRWFTKFSDELRTLAAWIIGLASLGGFVIAALTEGLEWLVFPALVLAIGVAFRKRFIYGIQALRNYATSLRD